MAKLKNLATCKPSEFLKQTVKIRKAVERWITVTDLVKIRKTLPELIHINDSMDADEKAAAKAENVHRMQAQAQKNALRIFDSIAEDHPEETLELLALLCFIDPAKIDDHTMEEFIYAISDMMGNEAVIHFFTSYTQLARTGIF